MSRLRRLIDEMRRQLMPYHHKHDAERGADRWSVDEHEYLSSWIVAQLINCRSKNRCDRRGQCAYYSYSDMARRNFDICKEIILRMESGSIRCRFDAENDDDACQTD
ncbi:MAG: hypothetical protein JW876_03875 [Candidatus Krumholzibacteriota bacterium]|nr:hypothetical protein [Candidatus Krumholzibacteriota bacterium]